MTRKIALIIEDADVRAMMQDVLSDEGYQTIPCAPSRENCFNAIVDAHRLIRKPRDKG